jgi:hypothetical protein
MSGLKPEYLSRGGQSAIAGEGAAPAMPITIGLGLALVLLYLWLLGHWFARVVMVLALAVLVGGIAAVIPSPASYLASAFARHSWIVH